MNEARMFKYVLQPARRQMIQLPGHAIPRYVENQNDQLCMWVEVPVEPVTRKPYFTTARIFVVVTTGDQFHAEGKKYIGSAELGKWFVAHVYEQLEGFPDPIDNRVPEDWAQIKAETQQ
jgi:hypothetical protein